MALEVSGCIVVHRMDGMLMGSWFSGQSVATEEE